MDRLVLAMDARLGVSAAELAAGWGADEEARAVGAARVEASGAGEYVVGVVELVVIPLAVNLASSVVCDMVRRLVAKVRPDRGDGLEVELAEVADALGGRVMVVRVRREEQ